MTEDQDTLHLSDPRAMRALAHPTRLRLLGELRMRGPQTVGMLSETVDEAVGSVSYHLGKLAEHGFVREAPELARNRRERWWRAAHARTNLELVEMLADPERKAASDLLRRAVLDRYVERLRSYLDGEATLDPEWVRGTTNSDYALHLTSDELVELRADLEALAARWQARSEANRADARTVALIYHAFRDLR
ncbi:helix-turn-helix domain-containing protein [Micromonospora sp. HK10]|uniref:winged helix-turn-helix domain-containing protein n=1 Tax=Micromonospora sp. HK10 TaxID=1538294 RepID=UPI000628EE21|nr:helix-turn-helix domain-containing protein [Micromonospora sp. HK10]KKK04932.1 ArsR family transcriptional regulator [Micromonospora sp. HK10]